MRVNPDRQTLILAADAAPRRRASDQPAAIAGNFAQRVSQSTQRVTVISARLDAVVTQSDYIDADFQAAAAPPATVTRTLPYTTSSRGSSFGGASAYARTQDLSERHPIIDTYA